MAIGNILVLGAVALIALFVVFGFLLGLLRGFRKSMFFTIVFIVVLVLSFVVATVLSKSLYGGPFLWRFAKKVIPDSMREGAQNVNSLKEFVRFYITHNYNEMLDSGITAGESIVANQNAMGVIDGLIVMIIKIVMLVASYLVLNIVFYIVFGLIYLLFLRQKPYIEEVTKTDEDGNETVEEREVKPKKKRLLGGLVGGVKGFVKSMVILIPITFLIGIVAQIEVPKSSSVNADTKLSQGSSDSSFNQIVEACQKYDNSIGKMYLGLDDKIMDAIISYDVKGADGKKLKVVVRKELNGFIDIYNTIEKEIGVNNLSNYNFKNNINSKEMRAIVSSFADNASKSNAITTTLTAVGNEVTVILADKSSKNDPDMALFFSEFDLTDKNATWWKDQIAQLGDIYNSFADMNLDLSKADTKEYNAIFAETKATDYENFVDTIFENELLDMAINGGLKYAVKKLPESYGDVTGTTNQVIKDDAVNEEFKAFSKLIDFIRDDIKFSNGNVDTKQLKVKTLKGIVNTEVLVRSKIVGKIVESVLKNTLGDIQYNGQNIGFNKSVFNDANFNIHNELKALVKILEDGYGEDFAVGDLNNISDVSKVGQICKMLQSDGMKESLLGKELFSKTLQTLVTTMEPESDYSNVTWVDEIAPMSELLSTTFDTNDSMTSINLSFDTIKVATLDSIEANISKSALLQNKMANSLAKPMSTPTMLTEIKTSAWSGEKWASEMPRINNVLKTLANENNEIIVDNLNMNKESEIKRITFEQIENHIAYSEALENMLKNALKDSLLADIDNPDSESYDPTNPDHNPYTFPNPTSITGSETKSDWWYAEITGLCNVIYAQMGSEQTIKLSDINVSGDDAETKVSVIKALYADAYYVRDGIDPLLKTKKYSFDFSQKTNSGVSEYIQYVFKPELRKVSKDGDNYFEFTDKYDWDTEMQSIMEMFLNSEADYDIVENKLIPLTDDQTIKIRDVFFGLYNLESKQKDGITPMDPKESSYRNKTRINEITEKIDGITYLQFILRPEMKKIMCNNIANPDSYEYYVEGHKPEDWDNSDWIREMGALNDIAQKLITETNPNMAGIDFYSLEKTDIETICNATKSSYLLQSKMAKSLVDAGINDTSVTTVSSLTGTKTLMKYILEYDWNTTISENEAYGVVMDSLYEKFDELKALKNSWYDYDIPSKISQFYKEEGKINVLVIIDGNTGSVTDKDNNSILTDNVSTELSAVRTYSEYCLMVSALNSSSDSILGATAASVAVRGNTFVYSE